MVRRELWEAIRRVADEEGLSIRALARRFELDRKTVRRCLKGEDWRPDQRAARTDTLLAEHAEFLRGRAPQVGYSAQILYQELLAQYGFQGRYPTVQRFVRPLRALAPVAAGTVTRFESAPGVQSQIDWGERWVAFRRGPVKMHLFVLTLGFSRRAYYGGFPNERLAQFLEAHERAFEHFGGTSTTAPARCASRALRGASSGTPPSRPLPTTGDSSRGCAGPTGPKPRARSSAA